MVPRNKSCDFRPSHLIQETLSSRFSIRACPRGRCTGPPAALSKRAGETEFKQARVKGWNCGVLQLPIVCRCFIYEVVTIFFTFAQTLLSRLRVVSKRFFWEYPVDGILVPVGNGVKRGAGQTGRTPVLWSFFLRQGEVIFHHQTRMLKRCLGNRWDLNTGCAGGVNNSCQLQASFWFSRWIASTRNSRLHQLET